MKQLAFYHKETGLLSPYHLLTSDDGAIGANTPADHLPIEHPDGVALHHRTHRIDVETKAILSYDPPSDPAEESRAARRTTRVKVTALLEEQRKVVVGFVLGRGGADRLREIESELDQLTGRTG